MARTKQGVVVISYEGYNCIVYDCGENKSPRFELYDEANKKTLAKSDNPIDFDPIVCGEEWAERMGWYEVHDRTPPKKRRARSNFVRVKGDNKQ